jgi:plasmid stabilization system protein ParE
MIPPMEFTVQFMPDAEKELAAYARAVLELFGPEQARQSVEDWMEELELMDLPGEKAIPDWRRLTIAAASRLAVRVQHARFKNAAELITFICSNAIRR